jgi:hypothetical protein
MPSSEDKKFNEKLTKNPTCPSNLCGKENKLSIEDKILLNTILFLLEHYNWKHAECKCHNLFKIQF